MTHQSFDCIIQNPRVTHMEGVFKSTHLLRVNANVAVVDVVSQQVYEALKISSHKNSAAPSFLYHYDIQLTG